MGWRCREGSGWGMVMEDGQDMDDERGGGSGDWGGGWWESRKRNPEEGLESQRLQRIGLSWGDGRWDGQAGSKGRGGCGCRGTWGKGCRGWGVWGAENRESLRPGSGGSRVSETPGSWNSRVSETLEIVLSWASWGDGMGSASGKRLGGVGMPGHTGEGLQGVWGMLGAENRSPGDSGIGGSRVSETPCNSRVSETPENSFVLGVLGDSMGPASGKQASGGVCGRRGHMGEGLQGVWGMLGGREGGSEKRPILGHRNRESRRLRNPEGLESRRLRGHGIPESRRLRKIVLSWASWGDGMGPASGKQASGGCAGMPGAHGGRVAGGVGGLLYA